MKLLAVDNDLYIRDLLPMILAEAGVTDVTVTGSAHNALSAIASQTEPFECFLLDIQMPGASGIELCADIRRLPIYRKTPIIMLTAMQEKSYIDEAFAAGATDYATKPFDIAEVRARVGMAKLLVEEQRRVRELSASAAISSDATATDTKPDFAEHLDLGGVKGLVSTNAFENYLGQLSRAGFQSLSFFSVHVQDGGKIFNRCMASEFEYALRHVADATIASPGTDTVIMCYVGSGNFLCCSSAATMQLSEELEADIQEILDNKDLTHDDGSPLDIEVAIGATVQPLLTEPLRLGALEAQAVKRAMERVREKSAKPKLVNIKRVAF
ncbi:MAG: response regulator [Marinovum algicola]|uniref:response regulator n=1 Tax=Roseobacteraceae TaxID=2854170 RepID=UPI0032ED363C